jgi:hypothetical protein
LPQIIAFPRAVVRMNQTCDEQSRNIVWRRIAVAALAGQGSSGTQKGPLMKYILALLVVASAGAAGAQTTRPEELTQAYACRSIPDVAERVACYDRAIDQILAAEQQGRFVAVDRGQVEAVERESFGFDLPSIASLIPGRSAEDDLQRLQLEVERVVTLGDGRRLFVMTDGQRWAQVDGASAHNVRAGDSVTVRRAALGTFLLASERGGAAHRVRRQN